MSIEQLLAGAGLLVCLLMAVHMALGPVRRARVDAWLRRQTLALGQLRHWRRRRQARRQAEAEAESLIQRAKSGSRIEGEWDGNVYRPKRFGKTDKRKLH